MHQTEGCSIGAEGKPVSRLMYSWDTNTHTHTLNLEKPFCVSTGIQCIFFRFITNTIVAAVLLFWVLQKN